MEYPHMLLKLVYPKFMHTQNDTIRFSRLCMITSEHHNTNNKMIYDSYIVVVLLYLEQVQFLECVHFGMDPQTEQSLRWQLAIVVGFMYAILQYMVGLSINAFARVIRARIQKKMSDHSDPTCTITKKTSGNQGTTYLGPRFQKGRARPRT